MVLDPIPKYSPYIFLGLDPSPPPLVVGLELSSRCPCLWKQLCDVTMLKGTGVWNDVVKFVRHTRQICVTGQMHICYINLACSALSLHLSLCSCLSKNVWHDFAQGHRCVTWRCWIYLCDMTLLVHLTFVWHRQIRVDMTHTHVSNGFGVFGRVSHHLALAWMSHATHAPCFLGRIRMSHVTNMNELHHVTLAVYKNEPCHICTVFPRLFTNESCHAYSWASARCSCLLYERVTSLAPWFFTYIRISHVTHIRELHHISELHHAAPAYPNVRHTRVTCKSHSQKGTGETKKLKAERFRIFCKNVISANVHVMWLLDICNMTHLFVRNKFELFSLELLHFARIHMDESCHTYTYLCDVLP